ncbi:MAG: nickel-dependent lactate racemase, partial [Deltaproteobacteria bacterium]|nr:nickel-dependent lactate racemase [Deltaproteobacteria bacterium]
MVQLKIPFGESALHFEIPEENLSGVFSPQSTPPLEHLEEAIQSALDHPLGQPPIEKRLRPSDRVLIISDDNTRFTPADLIIPALLHRMNAAGIPDHRISCIMALGTHRYMTEEEMVAKVGPRGFSRIRVFNHEWKNPQVLVNLGVSGRGTPLEVNRAVVEADAVIGLGAIVPHHIPGFSGSSKIIQPGICGPRTTAATHLLSCEGGGDSFLGYEDNP